MWDTVQNMFMKDFAYLSWTYFRKTVQKAHLFMISFFSRTFYF